LITPLFIDASKEFIQHFTREIVQVGILFSSQAAGSINQWILNIIDGHSEATSFFLSYLLCLFDSHLQFRLCDSQSLKARHGTKYLKKKKEELLAM